jgi:hypothetical protein
MKKSITLILVFTTTLLFSQVPSYVPTNGLLGWWPFTGNANDLSGNGNNGTVSGATLTTDRLNSGSSAFNFTTTGLSWSPALHQVINVPHTSSFNSNNISVSLWFNARSYFFSGIPGNDKASRLIGRFENGYSNPNGQTWGIDLINGQIRAFVLKSSTDGNQESLLVSSNVVLNQWNHILVILDNSYLKLFLNGTLVQEIIVSAGFSLNTMGTSGISIGCSNQANGYWYESDAKIDDIGFWNRALNQQEINNLYNASLSTEDFAINTIHIYPNPTTSILNFKSVVAVETIAIYNMLGQLVQQEKVNALEGAINIEKLAQGTYLVKVNDIDKGYTIIKN